MPEQFCGADIAKQFRRYFHHLRSAIVRRHGERETFVFKDLETMKLHCRNRMMGPSEFSRVSTDRVTPAYICSDGDRNDVRDDDTTDQESKHDVLSRKEKNSTGTPYITRSRRRVLFPEKLHD